MYNVAKIKNNNSEKSPIVSVTVGENLKTSSSEVLCTMLLKSWIITQK